MSVQKGTEGDSPQENARIRDQHQLAASRWLQSHGDGTLKVDSLLGAGGFSTCWLLRWTNPPNENLALKVISQDRLSDTKRACIRRELSIHSTLQHQNVVDFIRYAYDGDDLVLIFMEYCPGGTLSQMVKAARLPEDRIQQVAQQVLAALRYIHSESVLHRDIKPANILICENGPNNLQVKLADFGLSVRMHPSRDLRVHCGTPYYFSPEMVQNQSYSFPTDIWSYGITIYYCFVGSTPFYKKDLARDMIFKRIVSATIHYPSQMSPGLVNFLKSILVRDPSQRLCLAHLQKHPWLK